MAETSPYCVFVSGCILAQILRAEGCATSPAIMKPVMQWAMDHDINVLPMPCAETATLGLERPAQGRKAYEKTELRSVSAGIAQDVVQQMVELRNSGAILLGVIGVSFSPACSTVEDSPSPYIPSGIFMEELRSEMDRQGLPEIPFISAYEKHFRKLERQLTELWEGRNTHETA